MSFKNPNNRCSICGYVSDIRLETAEIKGIELDIIVDRPAKVKGGQTYSDKFTAYISYPMTIKFVKDTVKKGSVLSAKGEFRQWVGGTYKLAVDELTMKG